MNQTPGLIAGRAVRSTVWLGAASLSSTLISLAATMVLARKLSPPDFGLFFLAISFRDLLLLPAGLNFSDAIIQFRTSASMATAAAVATVGLWILLFCVALGLSYPIRSHYGPGLAGIFLILAALSLLTLLRGVLGASRQRDLLYGKLSAISVVAAAAAAGTGIVLALWGAGPWSLVGMEGATVVISFLGYAAVSPWPRGERPRRSDFGQLLTFSWSQLQLRSIETLNGSADKPMLSSQVPTLSLGLYQQSRVLGNLSNVVVDPIYRVAYTTYRWFSNDADRLLRSVRLVRFFLHRAMFAFFLTFLMLPADLLFLLFGSKWLDAAPIVRAFSLYALLLPLYENVKATLIARSAYRAAVMSRLLPTLVFLGGLVPTVRLAGLAGVALLAGVSLGLGLAIGYASLGSKLRQGLISDWGWPALAAAATLLVYRPLIGDLHSTPSVASSLGLLAAVNLTYVLCVALLEWDTVSTNVRLILAKQGGPEQPAPLP